MDKDDLSMVLTQAAPGETITVGAAHLRSMFAHGVHRAGEPIQRRIAQFAGDHDCDFALDRNNGDGRFLKRVHGAADASGGREAADFGFLRNRRKHSGARR